MITDGQATDDPRHMIGSLKASATEREEKMYAVLAALIDYARAAGYSKAQIETATTALFTTFAAQWFTYLIIGAPDLLTAIQNDITLNWLNLNIGGQSIRTRILARLS